MRFTKIFIRILGIAFSKKLVEKISINDGRVFSTNTFILKRHKGLVDDTFWICLSELEVCTGRIFQSGHGPARMATISARPGKEIKILVRSRPGPKGKLKYRSEPGPAWNKIQNFGPANFSSDFGSDSLV